MPRIKIDSRAEKRLQTLVARTGRTSESLVNEAVRSYLEARKDRELAMDVLTKNETPIGLEELRRRLRL